jgi:hypothetical protein
MEILGLIFNLSVVLFVVATMLSMGLALNLSQIIDPLKKPLLVADVVITNFLLALLKDVDDDFLLELAVKSDSIIVTLNGKDFKQQSNLI